MGVFIKGMEMPRVCAECFMDPPCCKALSGDTNIWKVRHPDCPLVEVKEPHGKLINAKELYEYFETYDDMGGATMIVNHDLIHRDSILYAIEDAPTIIEAEGREE